MAMKVASNNSLFSSLRRKSSSRKQGMRTSGVRKLEVNHKDTPTLAGGGWCKWIFCGLCMWCCYETCCDGSSDEGNKGGE